MGRGGDLAQVIHPDEMQFFERPSNNMPTLIIGCHLLLGHRRRRLGRTLIVQKSFGQSAAILDNEYRIWKRCSSKRRKIILRMCLAKHLPDVVSVPERKEPPLSIDPSNPSVDMLLSASWPPVGLCSGMETTR